VGRLRSNRAAERPHDTLRAAAMAAEDASATKCAVRGDLGRRRNQGGYLTVLCDVHATGRGSLILFLDFDGSSPEKSPTETKFCRLPLLEAWLRLRLVVDVVISSSWREVHRFEELVGLFAPDLQGRVVGCTPL